MPAELEQDPTLKKRGKRGKRVTKSAPPRALPLLPSLAPSLRLFWIGVAGLYLATVWLEGVGSNVPMKLTPRPWLYLSQVAALFVTSAPKVIDYRAEGWSCSERRWTEIDVRPYFQIDRDNKENRFQRALQFYRKNRTVMRALEDYVVKRNNGGGAAPIGGVRFSSLRLSYPAPGEHVAPYERRPLADYAGEQRHDWYWTPASRRADRCGQRPDPSDGADDRDHAREPANAKDKDNDSREGEP